MDKDVIVALKNHLKMFFKKVAVAVFIEKRLPWRLRVFFEKILKFIGLNNRVLKVIGLKVKVRRLTCDENFVQSVIVNKEYNPKGYEIQESDIVIDIGGNIGCFALIASLYASQGKVLTFEPNSQNYELLLQNLKNNNVRNVIASQVAVSNSNEKLKLYCSKEGGYHSIIEGRKQASGFYEEIPSVSLEYIFKKHKIERCNFLKIDCEGAEYSILYSLPEKYYSRIDKISMEWHGDQTNEKKCEAQGKALVDHLTKMGFVVEDYVKYPNHPCGHIRARKRDNV